jgi:hypothetical protein
VQAQKIEVNLGERKYNIKDTMREMAAVSLLSFVLVLCRSVFRTRHPNKYFCANKELMAEGRDRRLIDEFF